MATLLTWDEIVASTLDSDASIREDLQDAIYNVSPYDTPLLSRLRQVAVKNQFTQWQTDSFRAAAGNAMIEGIAFTAKNVTVPSRASNITQLFYESGSVSDVQRDVAHAGMDDPLSYYESKKLVELKKDIELAILKGSAITGTTSTAMRMSGFMNAISTNNTNLSGATLTETVFGNLLQLGWSNSDVQPTEVYVGPNLKRTISNYSTRVTPFIDAASKKQILTVSQYESDFGIVSVHIHRELTNGTANNQMLVIDPNWFATGWLQTLKREIMPRDGLRVNFQISCNLTLLFRHEAAAIAVSNASYYIP